MLGFQRGQPGMRLPYVQLPRNGFTRHFGSSPVGMHPHQQDPWPCDVSPECPNSPWRSGSPHHLVSSVPHRMLPPAPGQPEGPVHGTASHACAVHSKVWRTRKLACNMYQKAVHPDLVPLMKLCFKSLYAPMERLHGWTLRLPLCRCWHSHARMLLC